MARVHAKLACQLLSGMYMRENEAYFSIELGASNAVGQDRFHCTQGGPAQLLEPGAHNAAQRMAVEAALLGT